MRAITAKTFRLMTMIYSLLLSSLIVSACGGGGAASVILSGIGGTGIVFGSITGFGSVWVNGRRFEIDGSEIIVDGEPGAPGDLQVGMVVKLDVGTENGIFGGSATKVVFDDEIEGPINGAPVEVGGAGSGVKRFVILEQNITIDATRTLFEAPLGYDSIAGDDVVEVSGFRTAADEIVATFVRKVGEITDPPPLEVELRGTVEDNIPGVSFEINGVLINYAGASVIDVAGGQPVDGMFVEVEGTFVTHTAVNAVEIEQEDEGFGNDVDDISLHGVVSQYFPLGAGLSNFFVNGQRVDASAADLEPDNLASLMQDGLEVEVEGEIVGGILIADELELREGDTELRTTVFSKDAASESFIVDYPGVGMVTILTGGLTVFEDESATPIANYSFEELMPGHFVEVEGLEVNGNRVNAQVVKRREPNDVKLQGAVDAIDPLVSVTILGLIYLVDSAAIYEEGAMTAAQFFAPANLMIGDIVELEDNEPNGLADELEIDD